MHYREPPTIVHRGAARAVTPLLITLLVRDGLTPDDYESLDLCRHYYDFRTIGHLIADAFARCGEPPPPRTGPHHGPTEQIAAAAQASIFVREYGLRLDGFALPPRGMGGRPL